MQNNPMLSNNITNENTKSIKIIMKFIVRLMLGITTITIWTGVVFKMRHVEHMTSTSPIINEFFMKCGVHLPQSSVNDN